MSLRVLCCLLVTGLLGAPLLAQKSVPMSKLPFSAARMADGTLYISGNIGRTPDGKDVKDSVAAETHQTMKNIKRVLDQHGYSFDHVVKATVYLHNIEDYHEMNKAYATYFKDTFPARECVGGIDLVFGFRVEISMIAYKKP